MSDEKDEDKQYKKKEEREPKPTVDPVPKDPVFFEWLMKLFDGENQYPEKLVIRIVTGPNGDRDGPMIKQIVYQPGEYAPKEGQKKKPVREKVVALSNEILFLCQERADNLGKTIKCGIQAHHFAREPEAYETKVLKFKPRPEKGGGEAEEETDEDRPRTVAERSAQQAIDHTEKFVDMILGASEGLHDRYAQMNRDLAVENRDLRSRLSSAYDMLERAKSLEEERIARREWRAVGIRAADRGINFALDMAPSVIAHITGKGPVNGKTPESIALANFFKLENEGGLLTVKQAQAAFGIWDDQDPDKCLKPGVLSKEQATLLYKIGTCEVPTDEIDKVIPRDFGGVGGSLEITSQQIQRLQNECGFDVMAQLMPLFAVFQARVAKRQQAAQAKS